MKRIWMCSVFALAAAWTSGGDLPESALVRLGTARMRYEPPAWAANGRIGYACDGAEVWIVSGTELHRWNGGDGTLAGAHRISGKPLRTLDVYGEKGRTALISDSAGDLYEWDADRQAARLLFHTGRTSLLVAVRSPDGKRILTLDHDSTTMEEWNRDGGKPSATLTSSQFYNATYGPEGKTVFLTHRPAPNVFHYDPSSNTVLKKFLDDYYSQMLVVSPDKTHVLVGSRHMATEWRLSDYKNTATYKGHHGHEVCSAAYTPDGARLLTGARDGSIRVWNRQKRNLVRRFAPHQGFVSAMHVSPDGKRVLSWARDGLLTESVLATGKPYVDLPRHRGPITAVAAGPDGSTVVTASTDGSLGVWNAETGALRRQTTVAGELHAVAALPASDRAILGASDGCLYECSLSEGRILSKRTAHRGYVRAVSVCAAARIFLTAGDDGLVQVWSLDPSGETPVRAMRGHHGGALCAAVSADGSRAASGGRDGTIRIWDVASGGQLLAFYAHAGPVASVAFDARAQRLLSGGTDGDVVEWSLGDKARPERVRAYGDAVRAVAYAGGDAFICAGGDRGIVAVWSREGNDTPQIFEGHDKAVLSLTPLAGSRLISGSADTTACLWALPVNPE
jgi:WD40 repeat protein